MNKDDFLKTGSVKDFINWFETKMDKSNSLTHIYNMKKPVMRWECNSIYSAFENYCWTFKYSGPSNGKIVSGNTFGDSARSLSRLSYGLRKSIQDSDHEACKNQCFSILQWGGVLPKNDKRIISMGDSICNYLKNVKDRLTCDMSSNEYYYDGVVMNSGFTKIYSLCIDDFIIYDGRVGAALGFLVRKFCEDCALEKVPNELAFAWGKGKESTYKSSLINKRNPSKGNYVFPELMNNPKRHTENNIRANWLLREIVDTTDSKFNKLEKTIQLRALEASLFMIGYKVTG